MEEEKTFILSQTDSLTAIDRAQVDSQIATAHQFPRNISTAINNILTIATLDTETAEECFYALRRRESDGSMKLIEGPSVRLAEIVASSWGNLRVMTQIVANDGKSITARGVCWDLETNLAICCDVKRRITGRNGQTFSEDMQIVTGNAASAIALRNAIFKVVPMGLLKKTVGQIKDVALGKAIDLETSRRNCLANYAKAGVTPEMIFAYFDIKSVEELDREKIFELKATWQAIKEGSTTVKEAFIDPVDERRKIQEAKDKMADARARAQKAADRQGRAAKKPEAAPAEPARAAEPAPAPSADPETGEMFPSNE